MKIKPLCLLQYYGAKNRLSPFITQMLDYGTTTHYLEPFIGAGNVLINKCRHAQETLIELNPSMGALYEVLSKRDTAIQLIDELYKTEYSEDCFNEKMRIRNRYEGNTLRSYINKLIFLLWNFDKSDEEINRQLKDIYENGNIKHYFEYDTFIDINKVLSGRYNELSYTMKDDINAVLIGIDKCIKVFFSGLGFDLDLNKNVYYKDGKCSQIYGLLKALRHPDIDEKSEEDDFFDNIIFGLTETQRDDIIVELIPSIKEYWGVGEVTEQMIYETINNKNWRKYVSGAVMQLSAEARKKNFFDTVYVDKSEVLDSEKGWLDDITNMDLAVSAYCIFVMSRDGMGRDFRGTKYSTQEAYQKRISRLYDIAERLEGVFVQRELDAMTYFNLYIANDKNPNKKVVRGYKSDIPASEFMIYADPPYLNQAKRKTDMKQTKRKTDMNQTKGKTDKQQDSQYKRGSQYKLEFHAGQIYRSGWRRGDHVRFLNLIYDTDAKMIISGYDDSEHLYDNVLLHGVGEGRWRRIDYNTKTSISKKGDRNRVECFWLNY